MHVSYSNTENLVLLAKSEFFGSAFEFAVLNNKSQAPNYKWFDKLTILSNVEG